MNHSNTGKRVLILSLLLVMLLAAFLPAKANTATIAGQVFLDNDGNGLPQNDEKGLEGTELSLIRVDGNLESIISQVRSDADGAWRFDGLPDGTYYISATLPKNHYFTVPTPGGSIMLPGQGQTSRSPLFTLAKGEQVQKFIGAHKKSAYINLIAFGDLNMNSGRMSNEPLLRDVQVNLIYEYEGKPYVVAQGTTNRDGELQLRDLSPATYRIGVTMPEPYIIGPLGSKLNLFYNTVPPTETNYGESEPFDLERSIGLGIGGVKAGTFTGRIWMDGNMDGRMDANEGGYPGIEITLTHNTLGVSRSLTTTQDSQYRFEYLQAGDYTITATLPEGIMFALPGSPSAFQKAYTDEQSQTLTIGNETATNFEAIGVMPTSSITVIAFIDSKIDGQMDEAEPTFSGAAVEIIEQNKVVASAATNEQGTATLDRVRGGENTIRVSLPDGQVFTVDGGENGNAFSSVSAASVLQVTKMVENGQNLVVYAGTTLPSAISGTLFDDSNLNSVLDSNESGLAGFTVQAVNAQGEVAAEAMTDANGKYTLDKLVPASYKVRFLLVSPYVFSNPGTTGQLGENKVVEQTVAYGQTEAVPLSAGETAVNLDAGAFRSAVLNGSVLLGDDIVGFDGQSGGLPGVKVDLLDEIGSPVSEHTTALTDDQGAFSLKGALPGTYSLRYTLPQDAKYSQPLTDDTVYTSGQIAVKASDELRIEPLFAVQTGTISGLAYHDADNDGAYITEKDTVLPGVAIQLVNGTTLEANNTTSAEDGTYLLRGIRPGSYQMTMTLPQGYALDANANSLAPAAISGTAQKTVDIAMGTRITDSVLSAVKPITITGSAFYDNDLNFAYDAAQDTPYPLQFSLTHERTSTLLSLSADPQGAFATALAFPGKYQVVLSLPQDHLLHQPQNAAQEQLDWRFDTVFSKENTRLDLGIVQLGSFSGAVWNMDGSQNDVAGLSLAIYNENGEQVAQTTTDAAGNYAFTGLYPINYLVEARLPEGYRFARKVDTGNRPSVILSDLVGANTGKGRSEAIKLNMGEQKTTQDIGMGAMGRLGDYAWLDLDKDGMQDAGEPGIPGLVIKLYQYGQLSAQATTDEYGRYLFTGLFPGSYTLEVEMPAEIKPTRQQSEFRLVASILNPTEEQTASAENVVVPSGGRNLNADLGFVLRQEGRYPEALNNLPTKDWTKVNEQQPKR